jgi:cytoskeletal protein RodZ
MSEDTTPIGTESSEAESSDTESSDAESSDDAKLSRRTIWILVGGAILAAVVVVAIALAANSSGTPAASGSPSSSPSSSATPTSTSTTDPVATDQPTPGATPPPVSIDEPADIVPGLQASIGSIEAVEGEASGPGEIAGPSIRFVVTITNSTASSSNLGNTVVTAYYGSDQTPAIELQKPGGSPLPAEVAAGATATGTYIFTIPAEERSNVRIIVDYSVDVAPLVFEGAVPQ